MWNASALLLLGVTALTFASARVGTILTCDRVEPTQVDCTIQQERFFNAVPETQIVTQVRGVTSETVSDGVHHLVLINDDELSTLTLLHDGWYEISDYIRQVEGFLSDESQGQLSLTARPNMSPAVAFWGVAIVWLGLSVVFILCGVLFPFRIVARWDSEKQTLFLRHQSLLKVVERAIPLANIAQVKTVKIVKQDEDPAYQLKLLLKVHGEDAEIDIFSTKNVRLSRAIDQAFSDLIQQRA